MQTLLNRGGHVGRASVGPPAARRASRRSASAESIQLPEVHVVHLGFGQVAIPAMPVGLGFGLAPADVQAKGVSAPPHTSGESEKGEQAGSICEGSFFQITSRLMAQYVDRFTSRLPIPVEWYGYSHFFLWGVDRASFDAQLGEMRLHPPELMYSEGFHGQVQNPIQWGPLRGISNDVYDGGNTAGMGDYLAKGLADPALLLSRWELLSNYIRDMHRVTKPAPYADFATQIYGNPQARLGFWEFWDNWSRYETELGLGPRPPDPSTWLRRWHDPAGVDPTITTSTPAELNMFTGLSFAYSPKACIYCHPSDAYVERLPDGSCRVVDRGQPCRYHRYSVCPNTAGWRQWWRTWIRKLAELGYGVAFIDNCLFDSCWNEECQDGYKRWIEARYDPSQRSRFFRTSTSLLYNHSFESDWARDQTNTSAWTTPYVSAEGGARLAPDLDSFGGLYSCRIEGPGALRWAQHPWDRAPAESRDYRFTLHYRMLAPATASIEISDTLGTPLCPPETLSRSSSWTAHAVNFSAPPVQVSIAVRINGAGPMLVDEAWLSVPSDAALSHPKFEDGIVTPPDPSTSFTQQRLLRETESGEFWGSVVDERLTEMRNFAREVDPNFKLFTSSYRQRLGSDYYLVERQGAPAEGVQQDVGNPPGVYLPAAPDEPLRTIGINVSGQPVPVTTPVLITNIFDYKLAGSMRVPHAFAYHIQGFKGHPDYLHNLDSAQLCHAEAAAFGGGAGIDLELWSSPYRTEYARDLRQVGRRFFKFARDNRHLYEGLSARGDIGIAFSGLRYDGDLVYGKQILNFSQELSRRGVLWELISEERRNIANYVRLRAVVLHAVERVSQQEAHALIAFMNAGGTVVASGTEDWTAVSYGVDRFHVGKLDEFCRLHGANPSAVWPPVPLSGTAVETHTIGHGQLVSIPQGMLDADLVIRAIESSMPPATGRPRLGVFPTLSPSETERLRVAAWERNGLYIIHLLNYDVRVGLNEVDAVTDRGSLTIDVELPAGLEHPTAVRLHSPDRRGWNEAAAFNAINGRVKIKVPGLRIYQIIEIS